jgi:hypothetical protein
VAIERVSLSAEEIGESGPPTPGRSYAARSANP